MHLNKLIKEKFDIVIKCIINIFKYLGNAKYELLFFIIALIALFFLLHFKIFFNMLIMTTMLFCSFDSFNILEKFKTDCINNEKFLLLKNGIFIYILLPFLIISSMYFVVGTEKLFWFLSLIIFNKMLYYIIDEVMEPNVISYKIYGNRTIFSVLNSFLFTIFFAIIFSLLLKQNIVVFVLVNVFLALLFFVEEYSVFNFRKNYGILETKTIFLQHSIGLFLPTIFLFVLSFFKVI